MTNIFFFIEFVTYSLYKCIMMKLFIFSIILFAVHSFAEKIVQHKPEQGKFNLNLTNEEQNITVFKTLFKQTNITIDYTILDCEKFPSMQLNVTIIGTNCKGLFRNDEQQLSNCLKGECAVEHESWILHQLQDVKCVKNKTTQIVFDGNWTSLISHAPQTSKPITTTNTTSAEKRKRRQVTSDAEPKSASTSVELIGEYVVVIQAVEKKSSPTGDPFSINVFVGMQGPYGYLSADEYPLLIFYLIMCVVYIIYSLIWLIMSICNCRDLLRVQYWIGGVILLGLVEKIVHFAEYNQVNENGLSNSQMERFAEVVACIKRTVSRMLVIVVSLGFGIVKPRLGPKLYQVLGVGFIYFIVALLIKMLEKDVYYTANSREGWLLMFMPLLFIDLFILYWVLRSLMQTLKTLRLRRNTAKLSLYRHFTNIIILCALVSLGMSIYILYYHELGCSENFANDWFETACWPLLFSVILFVIMILWRPSGNNKRYAYSPLIDGNDSENDESEEPMLGNGVTESIKSRGSKKTETIEMDINMTDENLKWIDENIPPTVADAALPVLMDPVEIKKATKYEMSKMD